MPDMKTKWLSRHGMRRLHGLLGFWLCLVLGWICLMGTLTTVGHYLDWLADPNLRVSVPADVKPGQYVSWGRIEAAIKRDHPDWTIQRMVAPQGTRFAAELRVMTGDRQPRLLYVDPYRATVTGDAPRETIQYTLRQLHRQFYLPNNPGGPNIGIYITTAFSLVIFAMLVTGLVIYPTFWRGLFRLRLRAGIGPLLNDLHRLVAGWSLWFLLSVSLTGMWYFTERALSDAGLWHERPSPKAVAAPGPLLPLDDLLAIAKQAFPELDVNTIYYPRRNGDVLRLEGQADTVMVRDRANQVFLDPKSGAVLQVERIAEKGFWQRWDMTVNPLHYGDFAGLWSRLIWFVFGAGLTTLVFSGAWMYWRALKKERDLQKRRAARNLAPVSGR